MFTEHLRYGRYCARAKGTVGSKSDVVPALVELIFSGRRHTSKRMMTGCVTSAMTGGEDSPRTTDGPKLLSNYVNDFDGTISSLLCRSQKVLSGS